MKKILLILLLTVGTLSAQVKTDYIYIIDEVGFLEINDETGKMKENAQHSLVPDESPHYVVLQEEDKFIITMDMESPLVLKINSSYQRAGGIEEYRCVDINGSTSKVLINTNNHNIFLILGKEGIRLHVKIFYFSDVEEYGGYSKTSRL